MARRLWVRIPLALKDMTEISLKQRKSLKHLTKKKKKKKKKFRINGPKALGSNPAGAERYDWNIAKSQRNKISKMAQRFWVRFPVWLNI